MIVSIHNVDIVSGNIAIRRIISVDKIYVEQFTDQPYIDIEFIRYAQSIVAAAPDYAIKTWLVEKMESYAPFKQEAIDASFEKANAMLNAEVALQISLLQYAINTVYVNSIKEALIIICDQLDSVRSIQDTVQDKMRLFICVQHIDEIAFDAMNNNLDESSRIDACTRTQEKLSILLPPNTAVGSGVDIQQSSGSVQSI